MSGYVHMYGARQVGPAPDAELATATFCPLDKYVAANDNVLQANDKLRRLFKGQLTDDENVELDDAVFAAPIKTAIAKECNGDGPKEWVEGDLIPDCSNPASRGVFVPAEPPRAGDFMQTFTGRKYWPMDPRPHEVYIEDIAHSLSLQCRYAGHCIKFLSVAEHSVLIARHLAAKHAPEVALAGLLHDAPEAYCVDIPRPLKPYLTNYRAIEQDNWLAIAARFGLSKELPREVHDADNRIIADELVNLREMPWHARYAGKELGVKLRYWSPEEAELEFLATFDALTAGRA
ncbi:hypothetical protein [Agrobacterium pusense]|uniref:hypothetical protein n=1 Tax=Agrobacterium pusense TaxID=648995 RepID=UPI002449D019|nr:hypothetical protein [Agrobacterium pusense]MDH0871930.1 hypothetical protein [Agrobacterium pusense]